MRTNRAAEAALPTREYHEAAWEGVPAGADPQYLTRRLAFLLEHTAAGERVLDVGCGEGRFTIELLRAGRDPVGVDVAEEPLRRARESRPELDLRLIPSEGPWPLQDSSFDVVWAGEVIEHLADTAAWLSEARRVLKSSGLLLLSTPAHEVLARLLLAVSPAAFSEHFDPRGDHLRFYTAGMLRALLADFGFHDIAVSAAIGVPGARRVLLAAARRSRF